MNQEIIRYAKIGIIEYIQYEIWHILQTDTEIDQYAFLEIDNARLQFRNHLIELTENNLKINSIVSRYVKYLDRVLKEIKLPNDSRHFKLFINMTIPQLSKAIISEIKIKSRFHLLNNEEDMLKAFKSGVIKVNKDLFQKKQRKITEQMPLEEMEDILNCKTLTEDLNNIFTHYEAIGNIYNGEIKKAENKIQSLEEDTKIAISYIMEQTRMIQNLETESYQKSEMSINHKRKPGVKVRFKTEDELKSDIRKIDNYKNLSIREIAKKLKYKSDSGYRNVLKKLNLPTDYHKSL